MDESIIERLLKNEVQIKDLRELSDFLSINPKYYFHSMELYKIIRHFSPRHEPFSKNSYEMGFYLREKIPPKEKTRFLNYLKYLSEVIVGLPRWKLVYDDFCAIMKKVNRKEKS